MAVNGATSSWSGYTHQGKVGLIVALDTIAALIDATEPDLLDRELSSYALLFESAEDFDILKGDEVRSRHQVKARTGGTKQSNYNDVLKPHTTKKGIVKPGFNKTGVPEGECYLHTVKDVSDWKAAGDENPECIKLYKYNTGKLYCDFSRVGDFDQLHEIYRPLITKIYGDGLDESAIKLLWMNLCLILEEQRLTKAHVEGSNPAVSLLEIYQAVRENNELKTHQFHSLKQQIIDAWEERLRRKTSLGHDLSLPQAIRAKETFESLCLLQERDFFRVLNILHPHEKAILGVAKNGVDRVVYEGFELLDDNIDVQNMLLDREGNYILTALDQREDHGSTYAGDIVNRMVENPHVTDQIFKKSHIINENISGKFHDLLERNSTSSPLYKKTEMFGESLDHVNNPVDIEFVKLSDLVAAQNEGKLE